MLAVPGKGVMDLLERRVTVAGGIPRLTTVRRRSLRVLSGGEAGGVPRLAKLDPEARRCIHAGEARPDGQRPLPDPASDGGARASSRRHSHLPARRGLLEACRTTNGETRW